MNKTNFRKIIRELIKAGSSNALLAHHCECSETYIAQLAKGRSRPGYDIGVKLIELHDKGFRNCRES